MATAFYCLAVYECSRLAERDGRLDAYAHNVWLVGTRWRCAAVVLACLGLTSAGLFAPQIGKRLGLPPE